MTSISNCRFCAAPLDFTLIDLGVQPLANSYVDPASATEEPRFPLRVCVCRNCFLAQTDVTPPPETIFKHYAYLSSQSASWVEHARSYALQSIERFRLYSNSLVVEIASNDGYLLQSFVQALSLIHI